MNYGISQSMQSFAIYLLKETWAQEHRRHAFVPMRFPLDMPTICRKCGKRKRTKLHT